MRYNDFKISDPVEELAKRLVKIGPNDYNAVKKLMNRVSTHHELSSEKLHHMFISKYGHTPDTWIRKIKQRNEDSIDEANPNQQAALYNPNGKTYRGAYNKMPTLDNPNDIYNRSKPQSLDALGDEEVDEPNADESLKRFIKKHLDELGPREQKILYLRYWHDKTLQEVAALLNVNASRVRQIEAAAFRKLKKRTTDSSLDDATPYRQIYATESVDSSEQEEQVRKFVEWAKQTLKVQGAPKFTFSKDTEEAQEGHHTGRHSGDEIWVYIGNRNLVDIFRTVFHELVHQRQDELGMIKDGDSYPGSPIEAMADMLAGKYIKIYGKEHPEIFQ